MCNTPNIVRQSSRKRNTNLCTAEFKTDNFPTLNEFHECVLSRLQYSHGDDARNSRVILKFFLTTYVTNMYYRDVSVIVLKAFDDYFLVSPTGGKIPRHDDVTNEMYQVNNLSYVHLSSFGKSICSEVQTRKRLNVTCGDYSSRKETEGFRATQIIYFSYPPTRSTICIHRYVFHTIQKRPFAITDKPE